jgi:ribosome-binding factor A
MVESNRQKKIAGVLQQDLAELLQAMLKEGGQTGIIISVSQVQVTVDLSQAKVHLSIFPSKDAEAILSEIRQVSPQIRHRIAALTKDQLRRMPELSFYLDDSLDYIEKIDRAFDGSEDPIKNPELLAKRKKK